nr:hypothetical protein [Candidatus Woesearchaeota archaeon]
MVESDFWSIILSLISIAISIIAIVNKEYRVLIISIFGIFFAGYFLLSLYDRIDKNSEDIQKLNEKLKIYKELTDIKADIKHLKKEASKK